MQRITIRAIWGISLALILALWLPGIAAAAPNVPASMAVRQTGPYAVTTGAINVRGGPGVGFWLLGNLMANEVVPITGVSPDGGWWYVTTRFGNGWVADVAVTTYNTEEVEEMDPGLIGTVTAGSLNVRSGAGASASSLGHLGLHDQVFVLAQSPDGNWLQIQWAYGTGWVSKAYVATVGLPGVLPSEEDEEVPLTADLPYGIVTATYLNLRSGPGINYEIIGWVYGSENLPIVGRSNDSQWYQVETRFGTGWVFAAYLATRNEYGGTPVTMGDVVDAVIIGPVGVVNTGAQHVRTGPGPEYTSLGVLAGGEEGQIIGRDASWTWWLMDTRLGTGWVYGATIALRGDGTGVPYVDPNTVYTTVSAAGSDSGLIDGQGGFEAGASAGAETEVVPLAVLALPEAVVTSGALHIRSGPNVAFTSIGQVYGGTALPIIGQSPDRGWWLVQSEFGNGWMSKVHVVVRGDASSVPVVQ